jgi:hypothetical protein
MNDRLFIHEERSEDIEQSQSTIGQPLPNMFVFFYIMLIIALFILIRNSFYVCYCIVFKYLMEYGRLLGRLTHTIPIVLIKEFSYKWL